MTQEFNQGVTEGLHPEVKICPNSTLKSRKLN